MEPTHLHRPPPDPTTGRAARLASGQVAASKTRADRLAAQLVTSARPAGALVDPYSDTEAENLISLLLLAPPAETSR